MALPKHLAALTPKQLKFVRKYLVSGNGTKSAISAGYAAKSAHVTAYHLLRDPKIAKALEIEDAAYANRCNTTIESIERDLARIGRCRINDVCDYDGGGDLRVKAFADVHPAAVQAIKKIKQRVASDGSAETEVELEPRVAALRALLERRERAEAIAQGRPTEAVLRVQLIDDADPDE